MRPCIICGGDSGGHCFNDIEFGTIYACKEHFLMARQATAAAKLTLKLLSRRLSLLTPHGKEPKI